MAKNKFIVMRTTGALDNRKVEPVIGFNREADAQEVCDRYNADADAVRRTPDMRLLGLDLDHADHNQPSFHVVTVPFGYK
jgi:hypothetical protein